jgi:hypothetical protein
MLLPRENRIAIGGRFGGHKKSGEDGQADQDAGHGEILSVSTPTLDDFIDLVLN